MILPAALFTLLPMRVPRCAVRMSAADNYDMQKVAAMLAADDEARKREAEAMLGSAAASTAADDDEPDWVRARAEQEDQTFHAKRDATRAARAAAWLDEERAIRAAEANQFYGGATTAETVGGSSDATGAIHFDRAAWMDEERAIRAAEAAAMLGEPTMEPKTAEEKREEYAQDQLRQIAEADAMDERLARKQRAAPGEDLGEEDSGPRGVDRGRGAGGASDFRYG